MEQFRHIGEVLGSLKALMVLRDEIQINQRQCRLILDIFSLAFDTIAEEIRQNLKLEERNTKWKPLEFPLRELCRVFKEGEVYIKQCLDSKDWWGKAVTLSQNVDCVEFHIHNLLCYFHAVIEAIENAGEVSGLDQDEKGKKKVMLARKYDMEWNDPKLFQWRFGKQYLVPRDICKQLENAWREDRWRLVEAIKDKQGKERTSFTKSQSHLSDMLLKKLLNGSEICPISVLVGSKDYHVRRRLARGSGKEFKEIQWLGQGFALRHFQGERQVHEAEVSTLLSLSHPNILQCLFGFYDEEKNEFSLLMELMNKDLWTYMKENCGPRRQILFSIPVVVDLMLQMARGIEYLHSKKIYHGNLNPRNVLLKPRNSQEGYFQAKVAGFGLSSLRNNNNNDAIATANQGEDVNPLTWYAPEVLTELEKTRNGSASCMYTEKADAYGFGMICFELLTGKVPFEDNHLQGDRTNQNIKAGERPLFPYRSPKYLVSLIKKCWQTDPAQRPSFSSICRILRYTKKFLSMNTEYYIVNPELNQLELQSPPVDCCDIEAMFLKNFVMERACDVSQIPYEMFAYKVAEKGKMDLSNSSNKGKCCDEAKEEPLECKSESDEQNTVVGDDTAFIMEDQLSPAESVSPETPLRKSVTIKKPPRNAKKDQGMPKLRGTKSLPSTSSRALKATKVNQSSLVSGPLSHGRRKSTQVFESPLVSLPMSSPRRKKIEGKVLMDSKSSSKLKERDQSPLTRYGSLADSNSTLKMKRPQLTSSPSSSPPRMRRVHTEANLRVLKGPSTPPHVLSTPKRCSNRKYRDHHVMDFDGGSKVTRSRLSPLSSSSSSPPVRSRNTMGHDSDSESSFMNKRGSMSPLVLSPLSPYVRTTCGHVSD